MRACRVETGRKRAEDCLTDAPLLPPTPPQNIDLPSGKSVEVDCVATGKYVTLATPKDLVLCDIFVIGTPVRAWRASQHVPARKAACLSFQAVN